MSDHTDLMIPRCMHGHIILGCPNDDCPTQNAHLAEQRAALDLWHAKQQRAAADLVAAHLRAY